MRNPLLDDEFLKELCSQKEREVFAKIIALTFDEKPTEEITGSVTQGSISIDGSSAIRRSCSLTLIAQETNIHEYYWGLNTKFKLMVGLTNKINPDYPDIIWFPQGYYIITSFNTTQNTNSYTISIQGKDKMCLLNGDVGGVITAKTVNFGKLTVINNDGTQTKEDFLLKDIIFEGVHEYAKEPYHNIIINDLDEAAVELIEYRGKDPLYLIVDSDTNEVSNMTLNEKQTYFANASGNTTIALDNKNLIFDPRIELSIDRELITPTTIYSEYTKKDGTKARRPHTVIKAEYGDVVGYRVTDLTYPGDFIANVGTSFTSGCLDKIKNMLGDYEYFYNVDGQFVFQKKKTFVNTSWNNLKTQECDYIPVNLTPSTYRQNTYYTKDLNSSTRYILATGDFQAGKKYYRRVYNETYAENAAATSATTYSFENSNLITSFQNTPDLQNLKNDYSVWGQRTSVSGQNLPVHVRYAIDRKPVYYKSYDGIIYTTKDESPEISELVQEFESQVSILQKEYNDTIAAVENYPKKPNPNGLSEDWWDVLDWANKYALIAGDYPDEALYKYTKNYVPAGTINLNDYFPEPYDGGLYYDPYNNMNYTYSRSFPRSEIGKWRNRDINVFDVNSDGTLGYFGHGSGCTHKYELFVSNYNYNMHSYIYKPEIPVMTLQEFETTIALKREELNEKIDEIKKYYVANCEWREIIYRMAYDYNRHSHDDDFLATIAKNNPDYYPNGYTGYEQYYTDMLSFWRQLYDSEYSGSYKVVSINNQLYLKEPSKYYWYVQCSIDPNDTETIAKDKFYKNKPYYIQMANGSYSQKKTLTWEDFAQNPQLFYRLERGSTSKPYVAVGRHYYTKIDDEYDESGWAKVVSESPEALNFWFDFLDTEGELAQYSAYAIGDRPKAENDDTIKSIYFRETPTVIFYDSTTPQKDLEDQRKQKTGYTFINLQAGLSNLFTMSGRGKSAMDKLDTLLYNYSYCAEAITINTLPIYHLEPNTRIFVRDDNSGINGEYIITRITLPLGHSGTMSISATKAVERIY